MNKSPTQKDIFWINHIRKFAKSNLSQAEYCKLNNLHPKTFSVRKSILSKQKIKDINDKFIPINNPTQTTSIKINNHTTITFDQLPDPKWLSSLISLIGENHDFH